jgi:hypothetical protein
LVENAPDYRSVFFGWQWVPPCGFCGRVNPLPALLENVYPIMNT